MPINCWTQIGAGVCLLIFAGMLFNLVRLRGRMRAAMNWDKVEGVIASPGWTSWPRTSPTI